MWCQLPWKSDQLDLPTLNCCRHPTMVVAAEAAAPMEVKVDVLGKIDLMEVVLELVVVVVIIVIL